MAILKSAVAVGLLGLVFASPAAAVVNNTTFANFSQTTSARLFSYDEIAGGNSISLNGETRFNVLEFGPQGSYLVRTSLFATSNNQFVDNGTQFEQTGFNGSITFTQGASFFTAAFENATFSFDGDGGSGSLISTDPTSPISYTSNVLDVSNFTTRDFAFGLTGVTPGFGVNAQGFGTAFDANLTGAFAGGTGAVPEPASWAMLIAGFGLVGAAKRRRSSRGMTSVTA